VARKSAAALAILPRTAADGRLQPPTELSARERVLWAEIVESKPADWFADDSAPILKEYVRSAVTCDRLADVVERAFDGEDGIDPDALKSALDMRDKEARRAANLATKLRLTQQSRYTPQAAATSDRKAGGKRPWQTGS
jgi:hypothetical protein